MNHNENDKWISVADASKISGYHPEHIRRLIRENKILARKFSIVWQLDKESLLAYKHIHNKEK